MRVFSWFDSSLVLILNITNQPFLIHIMSLSALIRSQRKFKYDQNITEYFVETADTVKVKRAELERFIATEEANPKDSC